MPDAFLDSSVLIGLRFRHAGERAACRRACGSEGRVFSSRYVVFEIARGFLRSLIALYNYSFEFETFAGLHQAAHAGQQRFRPYRMHTWLGAFDDYFTALEPEDGPTSESLKLEEFRAKLRGWIRRGWRELQADVVLINAIGCREDLPAPALRADLRLDQQLPTADCGRPSACALQTFVASHRIDVETVLAGLSALPASRKDRETGNRVAALQHLLSKEPGMPFDGQQCHRCGDALICLESPLACIIVTKNGRHFEPLGELLGKRVSVARNRQPGRDAAAAD